MQLNHIVLYSAGAFVIVDSDRIHQAEWYIDLISSCSLQCMLFLYLFIDMIHRNIWHIEAGWQIYASTNWVSIGPGYGLSLGPFKSTTWPNIESSTIWSFRTTLWNFNQNTGWIEYTRIYAYTRTFIHENPVENIVCNIVFKILSANVALVQLTNVMTFIIRFQAKTTGFT